MAAIGPQPSLLAAVDERGKFAPFFDLCRLDQAICGPAENRAALCGKNRAQPDLIPDMDQ